MNAYNTPDFSAFLHNPYGFLNKKQQAAVLVFKRKSRFIDGYDLNLELKKIITSYFGNSYEIQKNGLTLHYNELKKYVEENQLIGLILYGANPNNVNNEDQYISTYVNPQSKSIKLEISTICNILLKEYFSDENYINELCEKTPGFDIYYSSLTGAV